MTSLLNVPRFFEILRNVIDGGQVPHLRRCLERVPHESLLDVGCGIGSFSGMTDRRYVGVDIMPGYVEYARKRFGSPLKGFRTADALALNAEEAGRFDVVSFVNMIHHLSDEETVRMFERLKAVQPRYYLVVDVALEKGHWVLQTFRRLDRGGHFRETTAQRRLLEAAGCRVAWEDVYWSTSRIYPHSVLLAEIGLNSGGADATTHAGENRHASKN